MSQEVNKAEKQDLSLIVRAIGSDLEHTQVRMISSANADMLFHYWKVGHFILPLVTLSICANSPKPILWTFY